MASYIKAQHRDGITDRDRLERYIKIDKNATYKWDITGRVRGEKIDMTENRTYNGIIRWIQCLEILYPEYKGKLRVYSKDLDWDI